MVFNNFQQYFCNIAMVFFFLLVNKHKYLFGHNCIPTNYDYWKTISGIKYLTDHIVLASIENITRLSRSLEKFKALTV
jgi:hypothetical protein